jgi:hypothetical protein
MKNWLRKKLRDFLDASDDYANCADGNFPSTPVLSKGIGSQDNDIEFTVRSALGGTVVYVQSHDSTRGYYTTTHVIPDSEDIIKEIASIVSMESLRRS